MEMGAGGHGYFSIISMAFSTALLSFTGCSVREKICST